MFNTLLESKPITKKTPGSYAFSFALHAGMIWFAVYATAKSGQAYEKAKEEKVEFVKPKEAPKVEKTAEAPKETKAPPPPPKGFQVLQAPVDIPDVIPAIDVTRAITDERDFTGKGIEGGVARAAASTATTATSTAALFNFAVDKPAMFASGDPPKYPSVLNTAGIEGSVTVTFVVDTSGRADMTQVRVTKSDNELFTQAVRAALPKMRYIPAEVGDKKVKVWVEQMFSFKKEGK